jgi:hypothetical protein
MSIGKGRRAPLSRSHALADDRFILYEYHFHIELPSLPRAEAGIGTIRV